MKIQSPDKDGVFPPVGVCVYCGAVRDDLTKEHIIPYALAGKQILPGASCDKCQKITSRFERTCAQTMFNSLRVREKLPTRRKKNREKSFKTKTNRGVLDLPIEYCYSTRPIVRLLDPGILRVPQVHEKGFVGCNLSVQEAPPQRNVWKDKKISVMESDQVFHVESLALLYAKIAHCYSVAWFGMDSFEHWLPKYILGENEHLSYLIGGSKLSEAPTKQLHEARCRLSNLGEGLDNLIEIDIRLFACLGGPWSKVITGKMKSEHVESRI